MLRSVDHWSAIACMSVSSSMCWYQSTSMVEKIAASSLREYSSPRSRSGCRYIYTALTYVDMTKRESYFAVHTYSYNGVQHLNVAALVNEQVPKRVAQGLRLGFLAARTGSADGRE